MSNYSDFASLVSRYARAVDTRDWDLQATLFTEEIDLDFSGLIPALQLRMTSVDWRARSRSTFPGLDASQHLLSPLDILEDTGETATVITYMRADHFLTEAGVRSEFTVGGYYIWGLVRAGSGWLISAITLKVLWTSGDPSVLERARTRVSESMDGSPA